MMKLPEYVQIEPVGECNLKCQMCPIQYRTDNRGSATPAFMKWELFQSLVDQFPTLSHLHLQGLGEPLMHPRFFDMIEYATQRGARVTTNSNLTLLSDRRANRCVTSGLNCIHVSIDGAAPETYERIRVNARFNRVIDNLTNLTETKRRLQSETPEIRLVFVLMRQNLDELADLVGLADHLGVTSIFVQHLCHEYTEDNLPEAYRPMRDFVNEQSLANESEELIEEQFDRARRQAAACGIDLRLPTPNRRAHRQPVSRRCDWPWTGAYFSFDGKAMPCCMISTPDRMNFGTATQVPVAEIWNSPSYARFRNDLESDCPPSVCQGCSIYHGRF